MSTDSPRAPDARDSTGREHMAWNVITNLGSYIFLVIIGFILPRMIDRYVGQVSLGIWDLCWSIIHYLSLTNFGIASSVNRYVAMHRSREDVLGLCTTVSTVMAIQLTIGIIVILSSLAIAYFLPVFLSNKPGVDIRLVQLLVILLGASLAVEMALQSARGVLTGMHRWDINNAINTISHALATTAMIVALMAGGGLLSLASVYLIVIVASELWRMRTSIRLCPELQVRIKYVKWAQAKKLIRFGGKTIVADFPNIFPVQTANLLIAGTLGPAALAVFARSLALVRHMQMFMRRFSMVLAPMVGSLHGERREEALQGLVVKTNRYGVAITLPIVLLLAIDGDIILKLWMGESYALSNAITILAAGYFLPVAQGTLIHALIGINALGRIALIKLVVVTTVFLIGIAVVNTFGWSLEAAAWLIAVPMTLGDGVVVTNLACRRFQINFWKYVRQTYLAPLWCGLMFALSLLASRWYFDSQPWWALGTGCLLGSLLLGVLYWYFVADSDARQWARNALQRKWRKIFNGATREQRSP